MLYDANELLLAYNSGLKTQDITLLVINKARCVYAGTISYVGGTGIAFP